MTRLTGTTTRGIRAPIIRQGDDLVQIVADSVLQAAASENFQVRDRDVIGITESLLARAQGNYVTVHDIAAEVKRKFPDNLVVIFPILSRNRFSLILRGLALSGKKITLMLNYPCDEVGNHLMDVDQMEEKGINPYTDILTEDDFRNYFGHSFRHPFTGLDYIDLYKELAVDNNIEIVLANDCTAALRYGQDILVANIHDRQRIKRKLLKEGARTVIGLDDMLNEPAIGRGYNPEVGLLGSNQAGAEKLKLFPRDCQPFVNLVQKKIAAVTGHMVEVMVYGDGAFKDPQGKIWELADPVVSPGFTSGLAGTPNEIKMKLIVDNELAELQGQELSDALKQKIMAKQDNLVGQQDSAGTTPRQLTDLLGTLCDLTSGSGDKGTPIVLIQGYFDNYATE